MSKSKQRHEKDFFSCIKNSNDLIKYLEKENNSYSIFILDKIKAQNENNSFMCRSKGEFHHILPKHSGGPDEKWNLVLLSIEDHAKAHKLRYQCYNQLADEYATRLKENSASIDFVRARQELGRETMRQKGIGFYNLVLQKELGSRPKNHTEQREEFYQKHIKDNYKKIFEKSICFRHSVLNIEISSKPYQFARTGHIQSFLVSALTEGSAEQLNLEKDSNFTSGINRVLKGWRKSYKSWFIIILENEKV